MDSNDLHDYVATLKSDVFCVDSKWPQFNLLIDQVTQLAKRCPSGSRVLSLERNLLYGGISLFEPFFAHTDFLAIDCTPPISSGRGAYNSEKTAQLRSKTNFRFTEARSLSVSQIEDCSIETLIVPNLLHHVVDLDDFFFEISRVLAPSGSGYIFDSTLREWHQVPEDYFRLTPFALQRCLEKVGLYVLEVSRTGGPFSAILYCWIQALEYMSTEPDLAQTWSSWLDSGHRQELMELESRFGRNPVRNSSEFPTAYSVTFEKRP